MTTDGDLATEIARIERLIASPAMRDARARSGHAGIRPRKAATLVLLRRTGTGWQMLMGRRHASLTFMPGALVFPGGAVDPGDGAVPVARDLDERTARRLVAGLGARRTVRMARAIAVAAVRELAEETGLLIGRPSTTLPSHADWATHAGAGLAPDLGRLVLFARATTPPGPPRRFDTFFLLAPEEAVAHAPPEGFRPSGELEELAWISPEDAIAGPTREITRVMLVELMRRLAAGDPFDPDHPAPAYRSLRGTFRRETMA